MIPISIFDAVFRKKKFKPRRHFPAEKRSRKSGKQEEHGLLKKFVARAPRLRSISEKKNGKKDNKPGDVLPNGRYRIDALVKLKMIVAKNKARHKNGATNKRQHMQRTDVDFDITYDFLHARYKKSGCHKSNRYW